MMEINYRIDLESSFYNGVNLDVVAEHYKAKFVCETCIRGKDNWLEMPSLIFYTEEAHPEGSNYMALTDIPYKGWLISDGISCTEKTMTGIIINDSKHNSPKIRWSKYRHDYVTDENGNAVDGGRDYTKINGNPRTVELEIVDGVLRVHNA